MFVHEGRQVKTLFQIHAGFSSLPFVSISELRVLGQASEILERPLCEGDDSLAVESTFKKLLLLAEALGKPVPSLTIHPYLGDSLSCCDLG